MQTLDRQLTQQIGLSTSPTILGLLPVETSDQDEILQRVTASLNGQFNRLIQDLFLHPALITYAVAVAVGKGNTEANFYNALANVLGIHLGMTQRPSFSEQFEASCRKLGLVVPEEEENTHVDRYIRPVIFQAGILPYWVPHLAQAIKTHLAQNPCPDLEDEEQVQHFTQRIADRVPIAQTRLRRTLNSEVGPLVCRAILGAFVAENFDLLPPHYREPMRKAFEDTIKDRIRSPYLGYQPEDGSLQVMLPKQSSRLASYNTCWVLGSNTYNALIERTLDVSDLPDGKLQICLAHLRNQFKDQMFTVKLEPDAQDPFFVFRADGRRFPIALRPVIELPLGDYHFVLPPELGTNEDDGFALKGKFKTAKIEVFPGREDLKIFVGERVFAVRPRLGSDFMVQDKDGHKLESVDGAVLFYGDKLDVEAFTPAVSDGEATAMEFKIGCPDNPAVRAMTCRHEEADSKGAYHFYNLSDELVRPFLSGLPAGIHDVLITAEGRARNFSRRLIYWKGFRRATKNFGFVCDRPPVNFDEAASVGVRQQDKGLQICEDHFGPEVVIGIKRPARTFALAKPGIWLRLFDQEKLEARPIAHGKSIEVNPAARELLIVESGDTLPWEITCQHTKLGVLKPGQAKQTLNLSALLSQFGDSGTLQAENPSGQKVQLLSFSRANLARSLTVELPLHSPLYQEAKGFFGAHQNLTVEESTISPLYRASFRIGRSQVEQLAVQVSDFAAQGGKIGSQEFIVAEGEVAIEDLPPNAAKIRVTADEGDWVISFEANLQLLPPGLYFVDFMAKKVGQTRWQPLKVADKHGLSESRLTVQTRPLCAEDESIWGRLLNQACQNPNLDTAASDSATSIEIPEKELAPTLAKLQEALLFKYASSVWPGIEWLESALVLACQNSYSTVTGAVARVFAEAAVAGLSKKGDSSLSVHSTLIFGSQGLLLAQDGKSFCKAEPSDTQIGRTFREVGRVAEAKSLKAHVTHGAAKGCALDFAFLGGFANFHAVAVGQTEEFRNFNYQQFFDNLAERTQELEYKQAEVGAEKLLSAEHFLAAVRALNRRFRPLELVRNMNEVGNRLGQMTCEIQAAGAQLDLVSPSVKERAGFPNYLSLSISIGMAESVLVQTVSDLLLTIAGLGRLTAYGLLPRETFLKNLHSLLSPEGEALGRRTRRLSLLLSLAPELFAFHMLFWEATLKPLARK